MKKSDINCVLDSALGADTRIQESLPMRYLVAEENDWFYLYETSDLRYFDPAIVLVGMYHTGNDTPASFLNWFVTG